MSNSSGLRKHDGTLRLLCAVVATAGLMIAAAHATDDKKAEQMIVTPLEAAKFAPVNPQRPQGAQMAVLSGDPDTGPSATLLRMNKGVGRMHVHSADYHCVVLEGTMQHWEQGQSPAQAKPLGRGSYWFQPGNMPHTDACLTDQCLMFVQWAGKRDARLAEEPAD